MKDINQLINKFYKITKNKIEIPNINTLYDKKFNELKLLFYEYDIDFENNGIGRAIIYDMQDILKRAYSELEILTNNKLIYFSSYKNIKIQLISYLNWCKRIQSYDIASDLSFALSKFYLKNKQSFNWKEDKKTLSKIGKSEIIDKIIFMHGNYLNLDNPTIKSHL